MEAECISLSSASMRSAEEIAVELDEIPWEGIKGRACARAPTMLTPVHVSRTLRLLRERRIVEFSGGILEALDPPQLERLGSLR